MRRTEPAHAAGKTILPPSASLAQDTGGVAPIPSARCDMRMLEATPGLGDGRAWYNPSSWPPAMNHSGARGLEHKRKSPEGFLFLPTKLLSFLLLLLPQLLPQPLNFLPLCLQKMSVLLLQLLGRSLQGLLCRLV